MAMRATFLLLSLLSSGVLAGCMRPDAPDGGRVGCDALEGGCATTPPECADCDPGHPAVDPPTGLTAASECHAAPSGPHARDCATTHCYAPRHPGEPMACTAVDTPVLQPFEVRRLADCVGCERAAVALAAPWVVFATEAGLHFDGPGAPAPLAPPAPVAELAGEWSLSYPHVQVDARGEVWYVARVDAGPVQALLLGSVSPDALANGTSQWRLERLVTVADAPILPLIERAWVASARGALVLVLASADAAWSMRSFDGGVTFEPPESITPGGAGARHGAPIVDARGRIQVPFLHTFRDLNSFTPLVTASSWAPALFYATLGDARAAWTYHGGSGMMQGLAADARPALALGAGGAATFVWPDAGGAVWALDSWAAGTSWSSPVEWTGPDARASGTPATARAGYDATAAWWQEDGALVVARSWGGEPFRARVATAEPAAPEAALALRPSGRAVVAWVAEDALWGAFEREP